MSSRSCAPGRTKKPQRRNGNVLTLSVFVPAASLAGHRVVGDRTRSRRPPNSLRQCVIPRAPWEIDGKLIRAPADLVALAPRTLVLLSAFKFRHEIVAQLDLTQLIQSVTDRAFALARAEGFTESGTRKHVDPYAESSQGRTGAIWAAARSELSLRGFPGRV